MERAKLIKALEICTDPNTKGNCVGRQCPFAYEDRCLFTTLELLGDALSLIKELTEENERLRAEKETLEIYNADYKFKNRELTAFNRRWAKECAELQEECDQIKVNTVRKMQEMIADRCVKGGIYPAFVKSTIDQIAKEMLEDDKMQ